MVAWWGWLFTSPTGRSRFAPTGSVHALLAFSGADLLLLVGASIAGLWGIVRNARWTGAVLWFHAGAAAYASCWAFALAVLEPARTMGAVMMAPLLVMALVLAAWWGGSPMTAGPSHGAK